jgi:hypothetical protein
VNSKDGRAFTADLEWILKPSNFAKIVEGKYHGMSWLFSQALVEEYLGENFSDGEQSVPSNGSHIQQAYLQPDKMTKFSRVSRFGMTFKPLTESRGEELLTLYLAAFHAKTSQLQEKEMDLTEKEAECGEKWHGLLAKYDQDTHSWRTVQCSLLEDLNESLQTLPRWGMTVGWELYLLPTLVQTIDENESGLSEKWATPTTMDKLPPKSETALLREATVARPGRSKPANLRDQVSNMEKWSTPTAHNSKETNAPSESTRNTPSLAAQAGGKLNPMWVEWLMGWTLGWTDLKPLETDKYHFVQQQHGES